MITAINMYDCTCHSSAAQIYVPWPHLRTYLRPHPPQPNLCTFGPSHLGPAYVLLVPPTGQFHLLEHYAMKQMKRKCMEFERRSLVLVAIIFMSQQVLFICL